MAGSISNNAIVPGLRLTIQALAPHAMSHSTDDKGGKKRPAEAPPEAAPADKRSGRVAFDARGNPIWEWQLETGVYSRDVNTQKLKKLDLGELSIADSGIHERPDLNTSKPASPPKLPGGGVNPYDSGNQPGIKSNDTSKRPSPKPHEPAHRPVAITPGDTRNRPGGGGFNPYDSGIRSGGAGSNPYDNARAMADRLKPEAPQERRRTPADLRKLDEQIKEQRKKLKE